MDDLAGKIEYFIKNHPDNIEPLVDSGEYKRSHLFHQMVELSRSYIKFQETFAFTDLLMQLDSIENQALSALLTDEDARKLNQEGGFLNDSTYKGMVRAIRAIKAHIQSTINSFEDNMGLFKEQQTLEVDENKGDSI